MNTPRSPQELLPSRMQLTVLVIVFCIFCVVVPVEVAADLAYRGERTDLYHAALLVSTALVSGALAMLITRWHDRVRDALLLSEPHP